MSANGVGIDEIIRETSKSKSCVVVRSTMFHLTAKNYPPADKFVFDIGTFLLEKYLYLKDISHKNYELTIN